MATYKVIQDIEAEDKFLGPLTLKQFIFGAIGAFFGWLNFFVVAKGLPWAVILFGPPMLLGFFLAIPWSKDQPTEIWVLAKLRFRFKPKRRIWSQDGMINLVTITAPKKVEKQLTNNLSQVEVRSRLQALADTIDSRGWAIKNSSLGMATSTAGQSDRLISADAFAEEVPSIDTSPDDMFEKNIVSEKFDSMIEQKAEEQKQKNLDKLNKLRQGAPLESLNAPEQQFTPPTENTMKPTKAAEISHEEEDAILSELDHKKDDTNQAYGHMHGIKPKKHHKKHEKGTHEKKSNDPLNPHTSSAGSGASVNTDEDQTQAPTANGVTPAIMNLAQNDDLNVATIARQAKKVHDDKDDEVVVSLR